MNQTIDRLDHVRGLYRLKSLGYKPDVVFDVGCYVSSWTKDCIKIFPDAVYHMFDATCYEDADNLQRANDNVFLHIELLDSMTGRAVGWYSKRGTGDSIYKENTSFYRDVQPEERTTQSLNDLFPTLNIAKEHEILLKIDCQGSEIPILEGASGLLGQTNIIILELPFFGNYNAEVPSFARHIAFMDGIGYTPFDLIQTHYISDFLLQLDIVFIKKGHPYEINFNQRLKE